MSMTVEDMLVVADAADLYQGGDGYSWVSIACPLSVRAGCNLKAVLRMTMDELWEYGEPCIILALTRAKRRRITRVDVYKALNDISLAFHSKDIFYQRYTEAIKEKAKEVASYFRKLASTARDQGTHQHTTEDYDRHAIIHKRRHHYQSGNEYLARIRFHPDTTNHRVVCDCE